MASERADTGQGKVQWEESQPYGKSESRYRARKSSVGGVTDLRPMREQDTGQGNVQWEESQTYGQ